MANRTATKMWIDHYASQGTTAIAVDCKSGTGLNKFPQAVNNVMKEKIDRLKSKGMKNNIGYFALPMSAEDVLFNGNLGSNVEGVHMDVREAFSY